MVSQTKRYPKSTYIMDITQIFNSTIANTASPSQASTYNLWQVTLTPRPSPALSINVPSGVYDV